MATLIDHEHRSQTSGAWRNLYELAVTNVVVNAKRLPAAKVRAAEANVKSAVRRQGIVSLPGVRLEIVLSDDELADFNNTFPIPN